MYHVSVNNRLLEIREEGKAFVVNDKLLHWDLVNLGNGCFHILRDQKSYRAEIVKTDAVQKTVTMRINNRSYTVAVKDKFDLLLDKMGMSAGVAGRVDQIKAPMPGLIIDLKIKDGDAVNAGDPLLILEAMKMENVIKASGSATVKSVKVKKGDSVEKGQILIEF